MHGDVSRNTFEPTKHYAGVLLQQGRVQTDADWNEATLIERHQLQTTAADVIGPTGAPRDDAGFRVTSAGATLSVGAGRYYVDGILCENETTHVAATGAGQPAGLYAVWLDVWHRHVSAIEDPDIREPALGGPDTATRMQTMWQLRMARLGAANAAATCATVRPLWQATLTPTTGTLRAGTQPVAPATTPCELPPSSGYLGLENQLYRVEVHQAGTEATARFKWSRENGSVVAAVEAITGVEITVSSLRADDSLGFVEGAWVELIDDTRELANGSGELFRASLVPDRRVVQLNAAPTLPVDITRHARLRRWDQTTDADANGVSMQPGGGATAIPLERGIEVTFGAGRYNVGDYWLIPARTALGNETGTILWAAGQFRSPLGIRHHSALLGAFNFDGAGFTPTAAPDCREIFPPLTDIRATDVGYQSGACADLAGAATVQEALDQLCQQRHDCCGTTVEPVAGWERVFDDIPAGGHAHLCFRAADYPLAATKNVSGKGTILISGAGPASRIVAAGSECALLFTNCRAVTMHDVAFVSGAAGQTTPNSPALNGVITFDGVASVLIERVSAVCQAFVRRKSSCIAVRSNATASSTASGPGTVRIRDCELEVGYLQTGILVVNAARATIEDNAIRVGSRIPRNAQIRGRITDLGIRARLRKLLVAKPTIVRAVRAARATAAPAVTVGSAGAITFRAGAHVVTFTTDPRVAAVWPALIAAEPPPDVTTATAVARHATVLANRLMYDAAFRDRFSALRPFFDALRQDNLPAAAQGIVIGGSVARDIRIRGNTVTGVVEGIHVGVSHRETARGAADMAGTVLIADNSIDIVLPAATARQRYGIYLGNCESAVIESNMLTVRRTTATQRMHVDGIHVFGQLGRRVIVRQNHLRGFQTGVAFTATPSSPPGSRLWLVAETMAETAGTAVVASGGVLQANNFR